MGVVRYDNLHTLDLRIDRTFRIRAVRIVPALDVFNLINSSTVPAINRQQAADIANTVRASSPHASRV